MKLDIFKKLFSSPNAYIRLEALKQMSELPVCDKAFMLRILIDRDNDFSSRQYSLKALMVEKDAQKDIADLLFSDIGSFKAKRSELIKNMQMAGAVGFKAAKEYIIQLSKLRFFWNRKVRQKALDVLEGWGYEQKH